MKYKIIIAYEFYDPDEERTVSSFHTPDFSFLKFERKMAENYNEDITDNLSTKYTIAMKLVDSAIME